MIQTFVFCRRGDLLGTAAWAEAIARSGLGLELPARFDPQPAEPTFVRCTFEGFESGFELSVGHYSADHWEFSEEGRARIGAVDTVVSFSTFANAQEIAGSLVAIATYAVATDGVIADKFFEERLVAAHEALDWCRDKLPNAREQFNGPSKLRLSLVDRG
jgi:hypothetical protein